MTKVSAQHVKEERITFSCKDAGRLAQPPDNEANRPKLKTQTKGCCERAVQNGGRARRARHHDGLGERTVNRDSKSIYVLRRIH